MNCTVAMEEASGWLAAFRARAAERRVPIFASLELTRRCNYRCVHCYLGDAHHPSRRRSVEERDAEYWRRALDEWAEAGVLTLMITGGDPMLHSGFESVYRHAAERGMQILIFCNGSRITDRILQLFRELPPRRVEISLYGATARTFERVTRAPGSFRKTLNGIRRLLANGTRVALKSVALTLNAHELDAMESLARSLGCDFRYDAAIHGCLDDGSAAPLDWRLPPERVVALDMANADRRRQWIEFYQRRQSAPPPDRLYPCCAGASAFHANARGELAPCLLAVNYRCEAAGRPFLEVWRKDLSAIRSRRRSKSPGSTTRGEWLLGNSCPALHALEAGSEERESDYVARLARLRREAIERYAGQSGVEGAE